jgi:HPt (histidine-containing phosphotransfer) domain-containing protein
MNYEAIERTAHSLKGELGYLGLALVSQQAFELEQMGRKKDAEDAAEKFSAFESTISELLVQVREVVERGEVADR